MKVLKKIGRIIVKSVIYLYCKVIYRTKIYGKNNIPKNGPVLFCGNHRNYLDPQIIVATSPREMRFIAKEELSKNLFFKVLGNLFNVIYVKRDEKDISALKDSLKTLKNGECLGLFPEGTRNGFEKNDGKIKNGASYLALKTDATIIPIGLVGKAKPFSKNAIIYGKPIDLSKYKGKKLSKEEEDEASITLKNEIIRLASTDIKEIKKLKSVLY